MKLKIIGDKENNVIIKQRIVNRKGNKCKKARKNFADCCVSYKRESKKKCEMKREKKKEKEENFLDLFCSEYEENISLKEKKESIEKKEEKENDLDNKENLMKMINTQDFIDGFWEENNYTKKIKEKYQKEFDLLKNLENKNINDKIALTILVIYFITKEHSELLKDLIMIIKKGKIFIQKEINDNYENIIKKIGLE